MILNQAKRLSRPSSKPTTPMFSHQRSSTNLNSMVATSPLKVPLQLAISKVSQNLNNSPRNSRLSRKSTSSTRISANVELSDEIILKQMNAQVFEFLKKYFGGRITSKITVQQFIECIIEQYIGSDTNLADKLDILVNKFVQLLGKQFVILSRLNNLTKDRGLTGIIVDILKSIENQSQFSQLSAISYIQNQNFDYSNCQTPQILNLKNVLTQFCQSMVKSLQTQIYSKLNKQMRKLVLKYNDAENLLTQINQKINENIHHLKNTQRKRQIQKVSIDSSSYKKIIKNLQDQCQKQRLKSSLTISENMKLRQQNKRLNLLIHHLKSDINQCSPIVLAKQRLISTESTVNDDRKQKQIMVSNFINPIITPMITKIVPVSPLKRPSSMMSQYNDKDTGHSRTDRQLTPGINLVTKVNTPKNRRGSKPNMVYFA